jgi:uncharacterized membrane protein
MVEMFMNSRKHINLLQKRELFLIYFVGCCEYIVLSYFSRSFETSKTSDGLEFGNVFSNYMIFYFLGALSIDKVQKINSFTVLEIVYSQLAYTAMFVLLIF